MMLAGRGNKMISKNQSGFSNILLLGLLIVIIVVAFAGARVVNNQNSTTSTTSNSTAKAPASTVAPATINDSSDLEQTQTAVDQSSVDSDLNPADLNQDVNNLQ